MKILFEDYTFNAATQQITFNTTETITLERLLIITNVTDNLIIYNFADPNLGGTITNNVLTLNYNTTSMSNTDRLQIFIENQLTPASEESLQYLQDQTALLGRMVKLLEPISRQDSAGRQQIDMAASSGTMITRIDTYLNGPAGSTTIVAAESVFNLQSRIAYSALRNSMEFN
jgi:hypothetical protein